MIKNAILVVLYNKGLESSTTLQTLIQHPFKSIKLTIHNNGPFRISEEDSFFLRLKTIYEQVELVNCLENQPLSQVYNRFIANNLQVERWVILDDDTTINESFWFTVEHTQADIECPRIISSINYKTYYPISKGEIVLSYQDLDSATTFSIGSGLIIRRRLWDIFERHDLSLFDENYALYGVDFSVFRRIHRLSAFGEKFVLRSSCYLEHGLSRLEKNESEFRIAENLIDLAISARRYPQFHLYYHLGRRLLKQFFLLRFKTVMVTMQAFFRGKHPRCN
ncbi:glycosyl transferase [Dickeya dadantii]|uniref:glycosyltransferase family 2 protein n=1 Tax=Dickeya dadantii TaxID=204038 RepID=UPI0009820A1D|nr:glycosyl transferase [Dickeya dadantii]MCL6404095.1 glycosyl transferase [Dickeya dadantii]NAT76276.1 glycosyl transferase [Dickeya dadantii]NPE54451.1 glycosyl transferase [Dickeya dadantii]NPE59559.1 glycosyl transferase [Dickeya dadantii]NPE61544.1 glycosyl transferase [Dickeya dadantii]